MCYATTLTDCILLTWHSDSHTYTSRNLTVYACHTQQGYNIISVVYIEFPHANCRSCGSF